jgi:hypothetical protein
MIGDGRGIRIAFWTVGLAPRTETQTSRAMAPAAKG